VNALWLAPIAIKNRRIAGVIAGATGLLVLALCVVTLRYAQNRAPEATTAAATLVQQNLEVGAAAAKAGPPLTVSQELDVFSDLSLHPGTSYCLGMPELPSTRCVQDSSVMSQVTTSAPTSMIVWPEAPNWFTEIDPSLRGTISSKQFHSAMSSLAQIADAPIIVGSIGIDADPGAEPGYDEYNSANFIAPDGSFVGRYDKIHLVPFGEYTPYKNLFFFAGNLLQEVGLLSHGKRRTVFTTGGHTYGTFICYESVFGDEVRQYAGLGAEVLVNISDDGWYGDTSAAWEHLNMVRMRAIENHRWVLRATNTGVTASIDPFGRVVMAAPRHVRTSLRAGFSFEHDVTFYAAHGDLFAYFCALVTGAYFLLSLFARTREN
jgi:apolipoprotein N-acyltransferase